MEKALAAWLLLAVSTASISSPREVVQVAVEQVLRVVQDLDLARPCAAERRHREIRRIVRHLIDFPEMARRSLARHWNERTSQERKEFVRLFTEFLERAYFERVEHYAGERIEYTGETVDGDFATVRSRVITSRKSEVPVHYRLHRGGLRWTVYDIRVDGISLVSSYRSQFDKVIRTSSYDDLVQKLRLKQRESKTLDRSARKPC